MSSGRTTGNPWLMETLQYSVAELNGMLATLAGMGVGPEAYQGCGVEEIDLGGRRCRISMRQQVRVVEAICRRVSEPRWIVGAAASMHAARFTSAGLLLMSSEGLRDVVELANRYGALLNLKHSLVLEERSERGMLVFERGFRLEGLAAQACEVWEVMKWITLLSDIFGPEARPLEIRLADAVSESYASAVSQSVGCPVQAGFAFSSIVLPASLLALPARQHDAHARRFSVEMCDQEMVDIRRLLCESFATYVRALLRHGEGYQPPDMERLARQLCMSPRSLRRRLVAENTSYQEIIDAVRRDEALHLLTTTSFTTEAIALMLGYRDVANFRHAVKRWTGSSPRQFRQRLSSTNTPMATLNVPLAAPANVASWRIPQAGTPVLQDYQAATL